MKLSKFNQRIISNLKKLYYINDSEINEIHWLFEPEFPFRQYVDRADSIHIHIRVDDISQPQPQMLEWGGRLEKQKEGYIKYKFENGFNVIFSSIPVSQEDLWEAISGNRKLRPFLDHLGIDIRDDSPEIHAEFEKIPEIAYARKW